MAVALYMDVHIPGAIAAGLRQRQVDVLTAQEDDADELIDSELLDRAADLGRVLFTYDDDLLAETAHRQESGLFFAGVIFARPRHVPIGVCIRDLELIAKVAHLDDMTWQVRFLPL